MPIIGTVSSSYNVPPVYALSQTFNASGNYTVPAGKTSIALVGVGAGGAGGASAAGGGTGNSSSGGGGGGLFSIREITTTAGTVYTVTVGSGGTSPAGGNTPYGIPNASNNGGVTSFGNILTANGGNAGYFYFTGGTGGTVSYNT